MTKCKGADCTNEVEEKGIGRPREWCNEACRKRHAAQSVAISTIPVDGGALDGLNDWLESRTGLPESLVAVALALAAQCDARPAQAALWSRYQRALEDLQGAAVERERAGLAFVQDLQAEFRTYDETEHYRGERYRAAIAVGDEDEAKRWERMVPLGCSQGKHNFFTWPTGFTQCVDCRVEPDEVDPI